MSALITWFCALMTWTMDRYPGWPMCCMGDPSHCHMGACIKYVFSSSLFQCSSQGNCNVHIFFNLFLVEMVCISSLPGKKGHIGRGSLAVSLTCIFCPPSVATIAVTLQHWDIWRLWTPSLDLCKNNNDIVTLSLTSDCLFLDDLLHLLLVSNMCGECDALWSREIGWKESPDKGRIPWGKYKTCFSVKTLSNLFT